MPLEKPKPRKADPRNIIAATHAERIADGKLLYCVLTRDGDFWCKAYDEDKWFAYSYDLGNKKDEFIALVAIDQLSLL
jgi:hypothetical protein